jgi:hypothetical protein
MVNLFYLPCVGVGRQWRLAIADSLPLAWTTAYEVLSAPPMMGNSPKATADSGEAPWTVGVAPEGEVQHSDGKGRG